MMATSCSSNTDEQLYMDVDEEHVHLNAVDFELQPFVRLELDGELRDYFCSRFTSCFCCLMFRAAAFAAALA